MDSESQEERNARLPPPSGYSSLGTLLFCERAPAWDGRDRCRSLPIFVSRWEASPVLSHRRAPALGPPPFSQGHNKKRSGQQIVRFLQCRSSEDQQTPLSCHKHS